MPSRDCCIGQHLKASQSLRSERRDACHHVDGEGLRVRPIREELEYGGVRLQTTATLARAKIYVTVDVGFGDAMEPGLKEIDFPVLLDQPIPHLRAYARETVIAEKFQAMVALGLANSRMKDFYDVWMLGKTQDFDEARLPPRAAGTPRRPRAVAARASHEHHGVFAPHAALRSRARAAAQA